MKRSNNVPVGILTAIATMALAAGCGSSNNPTHNKFCGDQKGIRVDDSKCQAGAAGSYSTNGGHGITPLYFLALC